MILAMKVKDGGRGVRGELFAVFNKSLPFLGLGLGVRGVGVNNHMQTLQELK